MVPWRDGVPWGGRIPHGKYPSQPHSAAGGENQGRYIRHASRTGLATPILALPVAMVLAPFRTLLVATVGQAVLLPTRFEPTPQAAVLLSTVALVADPEDPATVAGTTKSLTENNFGAGRHPSPQGGAGQRRLIMAA